MAEDHQPAPVITPIDVELRVGQYVKLRDLKGELEDKHAEELKPVTETMAMIEEELKTAMLQTHTDSLKTKAGTASLKTKATASAADIDAFWTWIITQGAFDMLDKKPNVTAITEHVKKHGVAPPGVNYNTRLTVGVRRK